jgi:glycine hydroxymethyltransferase
MLQGGPLMHVIAAKAECFYEALDPSFKEYQSQVIKNISAMANVFIEKGCHIVSGGTDNHLILLDVSKFKMTGALAEDILSKINITVNKNKIPNDMLGANEASGIRIGSPAMTTRGLKESDFIEIANIIIEALEGGNLESLKERVNGIVLKYPLYV